MKRIENRIFVRVTGEECLGLPARAARQALVHACSALLELVQVPVGMHGCMHHGEALARDTTGHRNRTAA